MFVTIENLAMRVVSVRLNSGLMLHIPPRQTSKKCMKVEVDNNEKINKLVNCQVISLHPVKETRKKPASSKKSRGKKKPASTKKEK